jgi:hypothetical protein
MPKLWILLVVVVLIAAGGYMLMGDKSDSSTPQETMTPAATMAPAESAEEAITLNEQNESGESGTALITEEDGKVKVILGMIGAPDGVSQPAHIHVGSCPDVGAVAYPLTNVVDGVSETVLNVTLAELAAKQPLGINVHKSTTEAKVYVSCGDLNLPMSIEPTSTDATGPGMMKY